MTWGRTRAALAAYEAADRTLNAATDARSAERAMGHHDAAIERVAEAFADDTADRNRREDALAWARHDGRVDFRELRQLVGGWGCVVTPAIGSRWRVGTGNVYEVQAIESTRVTLLPRQLSTDCDRELRGFATDNRLDPDAEVAEFLARPMVVDLAWFTRRGDVREVHDV